MNNPKYTFLLPAYKAKFFAEALESIKNQKYKEFVCLVSDDCSPEDLKSIFDEVVGGDSRFTFRRNAENMGSKSLVSHWNLLVDMCETEYLIMASDDDIYFPTYLKEINDLVEKYPDCDLLRGRANAIDKELCIFEEDPIFPEYNDQLYFLYERYCIPRVGCFANYTFKTEGIRKVGGFYDLPLAWCADDATLMLTCKNGIANTPNVVFSFRVSGLNITSKNDQGLTYKKLKANQLFIEFLDNYIPTLKGRKSTLEKNRYNLFVSNIYNILYSIIKENAPYCSYKNMFGYYRFLLKRHAVVGIFAKAHLLYSWFRIKLKTK